MLALSYRTGRLSLVAITDLFDNYSRQARLFPGLLTVFPPLMTVLAWFPQLLLSNIGTTLLTIATSCGLLYALGSWARTRGKFLEAKLLKEWGGWPTTLKLRHAGPLDATTLARYHGFLEKNVPHWHAPTSEQELAAPANADGAYGSAVLWLKEKTRKGLPLVDKENAQYGFRRNLLGMKPVGIVLCALAAAASLLAIYSHATGITVAEFWALTSAQKPEVWAATSVDFVALLAWLTLVRRRWVRQAGEQYAEALLAACDQLMGAQRSRAKK
jgi:hypothetical protein